MGETSATGADRQSGSTHYFGRIAKIVVLLAVVAAVAFACIKIARRAPDKVDASSLVSTNTTTLEPASLTAFSHFGAIDFTCTGMTYDPDDQTFWIADYGAQPSDALSTSRNPKMVEVAYDLSSVVSSVDLSNVLGDDAMLQGIAYDTSDGSLWLADGKQIVNVDSRGGVIRSIDAGQYASYKTNGIAYDPVDDSLWVLFYDRYLIHYSKAGEILKRFDVNVKDQDQLVLMNDGSLLATVGADYEGNKNYAMRINKDTGEVSIAYQLKDSFAVEGVCAVDGKIYVANDGKYHDAAIKHSYIASYDLPK